MFIFKNISYLKSILFAFKIINFFTTKQVSDYETTAAKEVEKEIEPRGAKRSVSDQEDSLEPKEKKNKQTEIKHSKPSSDPFGNLKY